MRRSWMVGALACAATFGVGGTALAETERVTENDVVHQAENSPPTNDWVIYHRPTGPGIAEFRFGPGDPPLGVGSLELSTPAGGDKVFAFNYDHVGKSLGEVDDISYSTYRSSGSAQQVTALNLQIDANGPEVAGGFSTLVFEPVYNTDQGPVVSGHWQDWDADGAGIWWSTQAINGQCAGATAACDKTWDEIVANNPDAVILGGVGLNQGSGNPGLVAASDAFTFDETTYDFEPTPSSPEDCKKGGWETYGDQFKNQGDCVSSFAPGQNK